MRRLFRLMAAAFALATCGSAEPREITILHTNDLHARLLPDSEGRGGFAYVAAAVKQERLKTPAALFLHGGDFVQGTPVSTIFEGLPAFDVANHLGIDVNVVGNHEFDYGWQKIPEFTAAAEFPTLAANIVNGEGELLVEPPYLIKEVNGVRIGLIGVVTQELAGMTREKLLGPWQAAPVVATARRYSEELEPITDMIIVLAHCFDYEDDAMLAGAPAVDLIVSGHNHGGQRQVKDSDGRLIVKVRAYGRELGRLDLSYDVDQERIVRYDWRRLAVSSDRYDPDPAASERVDYWEAQVSKAVDVPIGEATAALGKRELKPLIERIMRDAVGADFAYQNDGGIRDALAPGRVSKRDIWNILPFGNLIMYGTVSGADLPEEVRSQGPVDPSRDYVVAANTFIAEKWAERGLRLDRQGPVLREAAIAWIESQGTLP